MNVIHVEGFRERAKDVAFEFEYSCEEALTPMSCVGTVLNAMILSVIYITSYVVRICYWSAESGLKPACFSL